MVTIAVLGSAQWLSKAELLVAGLFVILVFAFLDASYLREERGFRSLYSGGVMGLESPGGPNPLDYMAIGVREDGRLFLYEKKMTGLLSEESWVPYENYTLAVSLPAAWYAPRPGYLKPLSYYCRGYRYKHELGHENFGK